MITQFENLSNEVLFDIFEYINPRSLHSTFGNINLRLNNLLDSLRHLSLVINGEENYELINNLAPHVGLLHVYTWDDIDLHEFHSLYSLKLIKPSPRQLKQVHADIMPNLVDLWLSSNVVFSTPKQLLCDVFSNRLPHLRRARLGHIDSCDPLQWSQSKSLQYLHIGYYNTSIIPFILSSCPNLRQLKVDILRDGDKIVYTLPQIQNHSLRQLILQDFCRSVSYEDIITVLIYIPNTRKLELKFDCNVSFISLLKHIAKYLVHLQQFDCYITESQMDSSSTLSSIQQVHPCFNHINCHTFGIKFRVFDTKL